MVSINLREAALDDSEDLAALVTQLGYPTSPTEMKARLAALLSDEVYAAFVAEVDSEVVGLAGACTGRYFEKNGIYARLVILVTSDTSHGTGVGTALVNAVEAWAINRGAAELFVNSGSHRTVAHRFYESRGFTATGVRLVKPLVAAG